jgi:hypothetical protein
MTADWSTIAAGFVAGGFPWISQFRKLPIHFEMPTLDLAAIFNFFASLFSVGLHAYCVYAHPSQMIDLPGWYYFLGAALLFTTAFFCVFLYQRDNVKKGRHKWPVVVNFVLYILIFLSLTTGFGILKLLDPFIVISGAAT